LLDLSDRDADHVERRVALILLALALLVGAAARLWLAFTDDGLFWPDEIHQSLEPGHRLAFGYGMLPWEYREGARTWLFPAFCAALLRGADLLGLHDPRHYTWFVRATFCAIGLATSLGVVRLARGLGARPLAAAASAATFAFLVPAVFFAPRAMSETTAGLLVVWAFALMLPPRASRCERLVGASLLGLATMLRLQSAIFSPALLLVLLLQRRRSAALEVALVLVLWTAALGLLDLLTWGSWFHSAFRYLGFYLSERGLFGEGDAPPFTYYVSSLVSSIGWASAILLPLALLALRRGWPLWICAGAFLLVHSAIPHKELRYLLPALPLFAALSGIGLGLLLDRLPPRLAPLPPLVLVPLLLVQLTALPRLTLADLGEFRTDDPTQSVLDANGPLNRLLFAAYRRPDLCGLKLEVGETVWSGAYSYLHRRVPLYGADGPPRPSGYFNYVITTADRASPTQVAAVDDTLVLAHLNRAGCLRDPAL
jgi:GPI mannosyltransferase 3